MAVKISIITPVYNSEKFMTECIDSVINQTYQNWEQILIDDCSSDQSVVIIERYIEKEARIKLIKLKENCGAGPARNRGIDKAKGSIIAFLDSDDIWLPHKLETHVAFMIKKNAAFSHTSYGFINEEGKIINRTYHVSDRPIMYSDLLKRPEISCLTAMFDIRKTGKIYMPDLRVKEDYALWLSILKKGFVSEPLDLELAFYRHRKNSTTNVKYRLIIKHLKFLYSVEKLGFLKTGYYTFFWVINGIHKYYLSKILKNYNI